MVVYMARYIDSKTIHGIFPTFDQAAKFIKNRIEHESHYDILVWDLSINPLHLS